MLTLPRLDGQVEPITKKNKEPPPQEGTIHECIHLGSTYSHEVKDIQTLRKQRNHRNVSGEAWDGSGDGSQMRSASAGSPSRKTSSLYATPRPRSNNQFCGLVTASLSHAGTWLDSRSFADRKCVTSHTQKGRPKGRSRKEGEISEGERFVLKRCKDVLLRRYGSLNVAFKRLDGNGSNVVSPMEFLDATSALFKRSEAQILYRCLDRNGDHSVSLNELLSQLEDI